MKKTIIILTSTLFLIPSLALAKDSMDHSQHGHGSDETTKLYNPKNEKKHLVINVDLIGKDGNKSIGEIVAVETKYGIAFYPKLNSLVPGIHSFHIHELPDCGNGGNAAGGHWNPKKGENHSFPWDDNGHLGDLPALYADSQGNVTTPVLAPRIKKLKQLKGHSVMIHEEGDNHQDFPVKAGGGGARMACGVIK